MESKKEREKKRERERASDPNIISNAVPLVSRPTVQNNDIVLNFTGMHISLPNIFEEETIFPAIKSAIQSPK